jgi:hypothetical protein
MFVLQYRVDKRLRAFPSGDPVLQNGDSFRRNPIVAPWRPRERGFDIAGQEATLFQRAKHRVQRALVHGQRVGRDPRQVLGDFIPVHRPPSPFERPQQHQRSRPRVEFLLKLAVGDLGIHGARPPGDNDNLIVVITYH